MQSLNPNPMIKIQFASGITVTIQDGALAAPIMELTALLDALAATLPGYGTLPFEPDGDYNIALGIIEKIALRVNEKISTMPFSRWHFSLGHKIENCSA